MHTQALVSPVSEVYLTCLATVFTQELHYHLCNAFKQVPAVYRGCSWAYQGLGCCRSTGGGA